MLHTQAFFLNLKKALKLLNYFDLLFSLTYSDIYETDILRQVLGNDFHQITDFHGLHPWLPPSEQLMEASGREIMPIIILFFELLFIISFLYTIFPKGIAPDTESWL